ncbi:cytochrome c [Flavobacterium sp. K5-23]|uniref:c-type cytochrome n=1 Tax=Flavobacterium sp. K5-23 TaxID=2746225 RepID=UPI00200E2033|nr:cytochrome c [Flavobacterium sp. K5-23]UQD55143.1 cytochrome c [Flavobacterium sp. K5-23]
MKTSEQQSELFKHTLHKLLRVLKIEFTIVAVVTFALLTLTSCQNSDKKQKPVEQNYPQQKEEENHMDEHSGHSQRMNETKEWLKLELGEKYNQPVSPGTTEQLAQGKDVFTKNCVSCHGNGGKGDGPGSAGLQPKPADFTNPEHSSFYSNQGRIYLIKKGIKGTAMTGWENTLSEEEILSVYVFVNSLKNPDEMMEHHGQNH